MSTNARANDSDRPARGGPSPDQIAALENGVKVSGSIKQAALATGVNWHNVRRWLARGRKGEAPFDAFFEAMQRAKAQRHLILTGILLSAAKTDWRAAAYELDRRSAAQRARDKQDALSPSERVILLYPTELPEGAEPVMRELMPGHAIASPGDLELLERDDDEEGEP